MGVVDTPYFVRGGFNYDRGFDDFIWVRGQGDDTRPSERSDYRLTWREESDRLVAQTVTEAEKWLERHHNDEEPFFLYVDTWDPHEPWDAPEYYTEKYRPGYDGRQLYPAYAKYEEAGLTKDDVALAHATYCGEVTMVDFWMGRASGEARRVEPHRQHDSPLYRRPRLLLRGARVLRKAEWINDNGAAASEDSDLPDWLAESWLLSVAPSPLYRELTNIPLIARVPGEEPGRRQAMTTNSDLAPTVLDLLGIQAPPTTQGWSFKDVIRGVREEHRPFVISSWPLYFAEGEFTSAIDGSTRRIANYMPLTVTTRERSLILGGPDHQPELYDLTNDPAEQADVWPANSGEGAGLGEAAISFWSGRVRRTGTCSPGVRPSKSSRPAPGKSPLPR